MIALRKGVFIFQRFEGACKIQDFLYLNAPNANEIQDSVNREYC